MVSVIPALGEDFELAPAGTHLAVCYQVLDYGHQPTNYEGVPGQQHQIRIVWELPGARMVKDGRPFSVSKIYHWTFAANGSLRQDLEAWRGKPFIQDDIRTWSIERVLGVACLLQVLHKESKGRTYANVKAVMAATPEMRKTAPAPENPMLFLDLDHFDKSVWERLSDRVREKILKSPEAQKAVNGNGSAPGNGDLDDEIPF